MDAILGKIIEADKKARELSNEAILSREKARESMAARKEKLRSDYMARADSRLEKLAATREKQTEEKTAETKKRFEGQMALLDKQYDTYKSTWIEHIVEAVIK